MTEPPIGHSSSTPSAPDRIISSSHHSFGSIALAWKVPLKKRKPFVSPAGLRWMVDEVVERKTNRKEGISSRMGWIWSRMRTKSASLTWRSSDDDGWSGRGLANDPRSSLQGASGVGSVDICQRYVFSLVINHSFIVRPSFIPLQNFSRLGFALGMGYRHHQGHTFIHHSSSCSRTLGRIPVFLENFTCFLSIPQIHSNVIVLTQSFCFHR